MAQRYIRDGVMKSDPQKCKCGRRLTRYYHWLGSAAEGNVHPYFQKNQEDVAPIKQMIEAFLARFDAEEAEALVASLQIFE